MKSDSSTAVNIMNQKYLKLYPDEVAGFLESRPAKEIAQLFKGQPSGRIVTVLEKITPTLAAQVIEESDQETAGRLITGLDLSRVFRKNSRCSLSRESLSGLFSVFSSQRCTIQTSSPSSWNSLREPGRRAFPASYSRTFLSLFPDLRCSQAWLRTSS